LVPISSPTFTSNSRTIPAKGDGTSIVALSDSSVTSPWSLATVSPTCTSSSITGTPASLPMSGTRASLSSAIAFHLPLVFQLAIVAPMPGCAKRAPGKKNPRGGGKGKSAGLGRIG
jgi:hypothetical protein